MKICYLKKSFIQMLLQVGSWNRVLGSNDGVYKAHTRGLHGKVKVQPCEVEAFNSSAQKAEAGGSM